MESLSHLPLQNRFYRTPAGLGTLVAPSVAGKPLHFGVPLDAGLANHPLQGELALLPLGGGLQNLVELLIGTQALQADRWLDLFQLSPGVTHATG